ncbi:hypothetical protein Scep_013869 [Stephania cephalantha]|uniref:Uncharacterized protein n=1 Tax=Stephania cephalantha TaxID=152367 RepID=A0AAP0J084_9MAGN
MKIAGALPASRTSSSSLSLTRATNRPRFHGPRFLIMEEEGEAIEVEPSRTSEEESEPNNLKPSLIVKEGEGALSGLEIENEISM